MLQIQKEDFKNKKCKINGFIITYQTVDVGTMGDTEYNTKVSIIHKNLRYDINLFIEQINDIDKVVKVVNNFFEILYNTVASRKEEDKKK